MAPSLAQTVFIPSSQAAQAPLPNLVIGDSVDVYSSTGWVPCTISTALVGNLYGVHCGSQDLQARAEPTELRQHITPAAMPVTLVDPTEEVTVIARQPLGDSVGARYGTREPRKCALRTGSISETDAREQFICDSEHEFGGQLYLVSDVSLLVSTPRSFNANEDSVKTGIDPKQPVYDIRASYSNYQCEKISSAFLDRPNNHNCNEAKMSNAAGGCFKNRAGEWHCLMFDFHPNAPSAAVLNNVRPPMND